MSEDRRIHKRLPLTLSIAQPIKLDIKSNQHENIIPGIIVNISAGGMALIMFNKVPEESNIEFDLEFMGINEHLTGKVVREEEKFGKTYIVAIEFNKVLNKLKVIIEAMAEDFDICELRYLMQGEDACFPKCSFYSLCAKRIKKEFEGE